MPSSGDASHHSHASLDSGQAILSIGSIRRLDKVHMEKWHQKLRSEPRAANREGAGVTKRKVF